MSSILAALRHATFVVLLPLVLLCGGAAADAKSQNGPPTGPLTAVFVHGGGWISGTPSMGDPLIPFFNRRSLPFVAIDYPKLPLVTLATMVSDVTRQLIAQRKTNPMVVIGHSAGAHLAATATFMPNSPFVRCLILLDGIGYDLPELLAGSPGFQLRLGLTPLAATALSPTALIQTSTHRPAVFLAAGNDARGTSAQAAAFAKALQAKGFDVTLRLFPTMAHGDFLSDFANPTSALSLNVGAFLAAHPRCTQAGA